MGLVGLTISLPTVLFPIPELLITQVLPPLVDLNTPKPAASPASLSPVPMYMVSGFIGSKAIEETPRVGRESEYTDHVKPPSVVFQMPPAQAPPKMVFVSLG